MDYRRMAEMALERRSEIWERRKALERKANAARRSGKTDAFRAYAEQIEVMDSDMESLAAEARQAVEEGERHQELLGAESRAGSLARPTPDSTSPSEDEWRGMLPGQDEYRAMSEGTPAEGGYTVPAGTAAKYVDILRANAVLLKGIPTENVIRFTDKKFTMPVLSMTTMPDLVAENAAIPDGDDGWSGLEFDAKAYKDIRKASNEILSDSSLNLRNVLGQTMARNAAVTFDADAFNGDGTTTPVLGIVGQGVSTAGTVTGGVNHDDIADAVGRIWNGDAAPSVIWAHPNAAVTLMKEREGTEGSYLNDADNPAALARRLPILVSTNVPAGNVIVADGSRVFAGIREDVRIAVSEHAAFENDQVVFRMTFRAAGLYVVESASVQVLTPGA